MLKFSLRQAADGGCDRVMLFHPTHNFTLSTSYVVSVRIGLLASIELVVTFNKASELSTGILTACSRVDATTRGHDAERE